MTGNLSAHGDGHGISRWLVLLLALAMFVNYADRGSLAVAAPLLSRELAIGPAGMGLLLSSFFWTYSLMQPLAGMVAQRWPIRWVMAGGLLAWSLSTMLCGMAGGFVSLLLLRMLIGLGESVIFPANAHLLAEHAPPQQRGGANAAISAGLYLGPVAGTLAGGLILAHHGWRPVFVVLGAVSLLWLPLWFATALPGSVRTDAAAPVQPPGWREMLSQPALWGVGIGQFCYAYPTYLLLTWLPTFLVTAEHVSLSQMAWIGAVIPAISALGCTFSGIASDRAIAAGNDESFVRKSFLLGGMGCLGLTLLAATFAPHGWVVVCLAGTALFGGMISPMNFTSGQTLAGPAAAGRWMGLQNLIGNMSGVAAPIVTGLVVAHTGSFRMAFLIPAVLALAGMAAYGWLMGAVRPVCWPNQG